MEQETLEISRDEFKAYEEVRESGVTNMLMVSVVEELSGLEKETIFAIMKQYTELCKKYPDVQG